MAVTLTASLDLTGMHATVAAYAAAGGDLTPLMDMAGALLETSTKDRIRDTNMTPDGVPWSPSFRSTYDGGKTLSDTGRLGDSITHVAGPNSAEVGTNLIYGGIHQTGGIIQAKNGYGLWFAMPGGGLVVVEDVSIPARPYLGVSEQDRGDLEAAAVIFLEEQVAS